MSTDATSRPADPPVRSREPRPRLRPEELAVWRAILEVHARATRLLEAELLREHDLPLAWYDVLVQLVEAPGQRLRMHELADQVLFSRSGLTRLVDRMVEAGLVRREPVADDARGYWTVLTEAGYERLRRASGTHLRGIHEHVTGALTHEEAAQLADLLGRMSPRE